jgi:hypothetical protein
MPPMTMIPLIGSSVTCLGALAIFIATLRIGKVATRKVS